MVVSESIIFIVCSERPTGGNHVRAGVEELMEVNLHLDVFQTSGIGSDTSEPSGEGRRIRGDFGELVAIRIL